jgi:hypothetical protein
MFWLLLLMFFNFTLLGVHGIAQTVSSGARTLLWLELPLLVASLAGFATAAVLMLVESLRQPRPPSDRD